MSVYYMDRVLNRKDYLFMYLAGRRYKTSVSRNNHQVMDYVIRDLIANDHDPV